MILLLLIYAGSVFGVTVNYHYCCGNLVKISILGSNKPQGCACNPKKMKGCCKDYFSYQRNENHRVAQNYECIIAPPMIHESTTLYYIDLFFSPDQDVAYYIKGTPRSKSEPLFLFFHVLRI
ncbi:HYC_CC_PP family protein [Niastella caeni]